MYELTDSLAEAHGLNYSYFRDIHDVWNRGSFEEESVRLPET